MEQTLKKSWSVTLLFGNTPNESTKDKQDHKMERKKEYTQSLRYTFSSSENLDFTPFPYQTSAKAWTENNMYIFSKYVALS